MGRKDVVIGISEETNPYFWERIKAKAEELGIGDGDFFTVIESFKEARVPVFSQKECLDRAEGYKRAPNPLVLAGITAHKEILSSNVNLARHYALSGKTAEEQVVIDELHRFVSHFLL